MFRHTTHHTSRHNRAASPVPLVVAVAAVLAVTAAAFTPKLRAGAGRLLVLPKSTRNIAHGLRISIDTRWGGGYGYRPVRFLIESAPPGAKAKRDRVLRVELTPLHRFREEQTTVTQFLELPEGQSSAEATMLVPVEDNWDNLQVKVFEDGEPLPEFTSFRIVASGVDETIEPERVQIGSLFVAREAPRLRQRHLSPPGANRAHRLPFQISPGQLLNEGGYSTDINDRQILNYYDSRRDAELVHPADLPANWLGLTEIDLMQLSLRDLRWMHGSYPKRLAAVRRWLATGTTLWITDKGPAATIQPEIDRILGSQADDDASEPPAGEPTQPFHLDSSIAVGKGWIPDEQTGCATRRFGLGRVIAGDPELSQSAQKALVDELASVEPSIHWTVRHGVVPRRPHSFFDDWRIPGAGEPPVTAFRLLITLFVLVIGPLNIYLVRRLRRTYLIMVTIPAAAVLVTTVLLAYAAVRDGFGVQARVRSYTFIDQKSSQTVSISRQTYFASILPAEGMVFPADAAVYPLEAFDERQWSKTRRLDWRGDEQRLADGYLPSRQTAQFIVLASRNMAPTRLEVTPPDASSSAHRVTNSLGSHIQQLLVVDANGGFHWAEDIPVGAVAELKPATFAQVAGEISSSLDANDLPVTAPGFGYYANSYSRNPWAEVVENSRSLLDTSLDSCRIPAATPNTYLAIVDASPEVPLGAEVEEYGSMHVIAGRW